MASNVQPVFPKSAIIGMGTITAANTAYDGTGALTTIVTAGADGTRIDALTARPLGSNVATVLRVFIHNGTTAFLFTEVAIAATTAIQTAALTGQTLYFNGVDLPQLVLPTGYSIRCTLGTAVAAGIAITVNGGSYTA